MAPPSVCLVSLPVKDLQKAADFYHAVLGWPLGKQFEGMWIVDGPDGTSLSLETGWEPAGGAGIQFYLRVDNIEEHLKNIQAHGGEVIEKPVTMPDYGTYAIGEDPDGNRIGFYSPEA